MYSRLIVVEKHSKFHSQTPHKSDSTNNEYLYKYSYPNDSKDIYTDMDISSIIYV